MMDTGKGDGLTAFLAVWGAILSSITFGWTLYKDLRDRPKIRITARLRIMGHRSGDGAPFVADPNMKIEGAGDELFIVVSVINVGRRRFKWKGLGGTYRTPVNGKKTFLVGTRFLPKILEEQEALDEWAELNKEIAEGNIEGLHIWDGEGHEWKVSKADMERLRKDIKTFVALPLDPINSAS
jgi:hypothetical protein